MHHMYTNDRVTLFCHLDITCISNISSKIIFFSDLGEGGGVSGILLDFANVRNGVSRLCFKSSHFYLLSYNTVFNEALNSFNY